MSAAESLNFAYDHNSVEIVDGYGAEIRVSNDHLVLRNGDFGSCDGAERRISRGRSCLKRVIILSHEGFITLDAIEWASQLEVALISLDRNGRLMFCAPPETRHDAELRRTQAVAGISDRGRKIAAWIVSEKLRAQSAQLRKLVKSLPDHFGTPDRLRKCETVGREIDALQGHFPHDLRGILLVEGRGAQLYWATLEGVAIPWARKSATRVPNHWLRIQPRMTGIHGLSNNARDPFNAALNYVYAVLEAECKIAAAKIGLDSAFGFLHVDEVNRQNFIYDLMEPGRSVADDLALSFFFKWRERDTPIKSANFIELRDGVCRLGPEIARDLAEFVQPPLRSAAERIAEDFARKLRGEVYTLKLAPEQAIHYSVRNPKVRRSVCDYCGGPMRGQGTRFCGRPCFLRWSVEIDRPIEKAQVKLAQLRAEGRDPSHGGDAATKRGASNRVALAKTWAWRRSEAGQSETRNKRAAQARARRKRSRK
jgi:CRISPR-associated endonuclease Cas1